jgi:hypothetical protein
LGAIKNWVKLQSKANDTDRIIYCIVDLHSLSAMQANQRRAETDAAGSVMLPNLANETRMMAATLLACGIDPKRSIVYTQSHVAAHAQVGARLGRQLVCLSNHVVVLVTGMHDICWKAANSSSVQSERARFEMTTFECRFAGQKQRFKSVEHTLLSLVNCE